VCQSVVRIVEMGRSSVDAEVRPNVRFGSATCDYSAEVRPNFGKHSASFVASHLLRFALAAGVNESQ